jgi:predicted membrane chloride channel (bestrophin family)
MVAETPSAAALKMNPAVLNVVEQLLAVLQLVPLAQHLRELVATVCSPERVTETDVPLAAAG